MAKFLIPEEEVRWVLSRNKDDIGKVFTFKGKIFRAIYASKQDAVINLFESGLISKLVEKNLFPLSVW